MAGAGARASGGRAAERSALVAEDVALRVAAGVNRCAATGTDLSCRVGFGGRSRWLSADVATQRGAFASEDGAVRAALAARGDSALAAGGDSALCAGQLGAAAQRCAFVAQETGVTAGVGRECRVSGGAGLGAQAGIA
ncbi:hypothetical protein A5674_25905 [Mycobacterium malmoense]|nr:hypothetical protein A5674_25905 [Mycobacterium malmoense]